MSPSVIPGPKVAAPLNTHVWIFHAPELSYFRLRTAGQTVEVRTGGYTVPSDRGEGHERDLTQRVVELIPQQPLSPRTRYEVVLSTGKDERELSTFTTSDLIDNEPPTWSGPVELDVNETAQAGEACVIGMPSATVWLGALRDQHTPQDQLLVSAQAKVSEPSFRRLQSMHPVRNMLRGDFVILQGGSLCDPREFAFPQPLEESQLVLRAVDLAGNASAEHSMKLVGPLGPWDHALLKRAGLDQEAKPATDGSATSPESSSLIGLWVGLGVGALALVVVLVLLREQSS